MSEQTKKIIFWIITLAFPIILLGILELGLRIGGYNDEAQDLFREAPNSPAFLVSNTKFIERYFPEFVPQIAPNAFRKQKKSNTFRVFVFGGSSTQGFPYNFYYSFAEQLEQRLLLNTEGVNVEVINLGMTAVNSYVIRDLSKRVMEYEPDAVIIYAGHNEYYGSFGAASTQFGFVNSVPLKRLILWLKDWRLYQFLESIASSGDGEPTERRTMMAKVISDSDIQLDSEVYKQGVEQFESNISDVIDRFSDKGIPVFIGTVASNLKDQDPLTDNDDVIAIYEEGEKLFSEGDESGALEKFEEAKEQDGVRFRAPNAINEVIRSFASSNSTTVLDIENLLRMESESGIEDASLFIDHLHPNYKGHQLMAEIFLDEILELPQLNTKVNPNPFTPPSIISRFEETHANVAIARLLVGYPFEKGLTVEEELSEFQKIYDQYIGQSYIDSLAAVSSRNLQFVPEVLTKVINESQSRRDTVTAMSHYYELMKWQLNSIDLIERGIEYGVNNRSTDIYLANMLLQVLNDGNYDPRYIDVLSSLYLIRNNTNNAGYWLRESERLEPNSPRMLYNYTRYHLLEGDTVLGQQYFQRFLEAQQGN